MMLPSPTKNSTHDYGPPENWDTETMGPCGHLSVRRQEGKGGVVEHVSTWKPSLEEINMLAEGGAVILTVCGPQPAVSLHVEIELETYDQAELDSGVTLDTVQNERALNDKGSA